MNLAEAMKDIRLKIARGEFQAAADALSTRNDVNDNAEAQAMGARILGHTKGFDMAIDMFLDLEAIWPDNFEVYKLHCQFLQEQGEYNEAIETAKKMVKKFPTSQLSYEMLIDNLELARKTTEALEITQKALVNFPDQPSLLEKLERLKLIFNRMELGEENIEEIKTELCLDHPAPISENIELLLKTFSGRSDVHAVQTKMGKTWGYIPEKRALTKDDIVKHLKGERTVGIYFSSPENTTCLMALDLDVKKPWLNAYENTSQERKRINRLIKKSALGMLEICEMAGLAPLIEYSGNKGLHFWFLGSEQFACHYWRTLGGWLVKSLRMQPEELSWEIFPKQDRIEKDGLGNLVKLPLGIHQKSGRRSFFIDAKTFRPYSDQMQILKTLEKIDRQKFERTLGAVTIDSCKDQSAKTDKSCSLPGPVVKSAGKAGEEIQNYDDKDVKLDIQIPLPERHTLEIEKLLSGCRPMWEILEKARHQKSLTKDEKHVFVYIFSHLGEEGKVFIHQVLNQLPDYQPDAVNALIKAVPPNAPGCTKVRKRIPHYCEGANCNCQFRIPEGCYASPVIHAGIFPCAGKDRPGLAVLRQPANISGREALGGESASIDRLMNDYQVECEKLTRIRERAALLRRQINRIFDEAGKDVIETRIRTYRRLPEDRQVKAVKES
jgi:hypothetical protein